ncbi:pancreatic triacylglycerol lipase-like [Dermacentor variabilis]|uniref:pancreatic triacylglycerol lipase-like n=1 Tax=Dermacentor variabilis TaxID=34621 RepID=UPI003F5BE167
MFPGSPIPDREGCLLDLTVANKFVAARGGVGARNLPGKSTNKRANSGPSLDTRFRLFTRQNPHKPYFLFAADRDSILNSTFSAKWDTKIYIHGYLNSGKLLAPEMELKDRFLVRGEYNIIMVDWGRKSQDLYGRVVNQVVPEVGQQLAAFIRVVQV